MKDHVLSVGDLNHDGLDDFFYRRKQLGFQGQFTFNKNPEILYRPDKPAFELGKMSEEERCASLILLTRRVVASMGDGVLGLYKMWPVVVYEMD